MKKRKLKLSLNKETISKLQDNQMDGVRGGAATRTWDNTCLDRSEYPACAISGGIGVQSCNTCLTTD